jgi:diguanylate cyclase (GGDEF)-like protein/PAS domain S-box-containing protein
VRINNLLVKSKLRFADQEIEEAFQRSYPLQNARQLRIAFFLAALMGILYFPQDLVIAPGIGEITVPIRLLVILPLGMIGFALTFRRNLARFSQVYTAALLSGMLLALLVILVLLEDVNGYGISSSTGLSNITLSIIFLFAVSTLRFVAASIVSTALIFAYLASVLQFTEVDAEHFLNGDFSNVAFILLIGGFIGASREVYLRNEFLAQLRLEERFKSLVEGSIQGILIHHDHKPLFANQAFAEILGYKHYEDVLAVNDVLSLYSDSSRPDVEVIDHTLLKEDVKPEHYEIVAVRADGLPIWLDCLPSLVQWGDQKAIQHTVVDITQRKLAEADRHRLSQAIEQSPVAVMIADANGQIEYANANLFETTGFEASEIIGRSVRDVKLAQLSDEQFAEVNEHLSHGDIWEGEVNSTRHNGERYWEHVIISPIRTVGRDVTHFMLAAQDISIRKGYEERLLHQAHYDHLTDLPNRLLALDRLTGAISRARRQRGLVAVMFIDLDGFKKVNDLMGHNAGDRLLKVAARRLQACARDGDTIARLGGDEFAAILPDLRQINDAEMLARRIVDSFRDPFMINDREVYTTASIGISMFPNDGIDPVFLMRNADTAMYEAKQAGRNKFHFFTEDMNEQIQERIKLENRLRYALSKEELSVHFQPLIDGEEGSIDGAEALLRWNNDELGTISPYRFIPLAEDTGLIVPIGYWVLDHACQWIKRWRNAGRGPKYVAVNVSTRQFLDEGFVDQVLNILSLHNLPADALELEVTESLLLEDEAKALVALKLLKSTGIKIAIDDFGTGYSSLSYLKRYPFDTLKIDSSFVRDIVTNPEDRALIQAMVAMAHNLSLKVVAEGVESREQLDLVQTYGCDIIQGYYFGQPMPSALFDELVEQSERERDVAG